LKGLEIRLITLEETAQFNELVVKHHYLKSSRLVGEHLRYVATFEGEWLTMGMIRQMKERLNHRVRFCVHVDDGF